MKLEFISLMLKIKNNQNIYKFKNKYFKKFCRKSKLIIKLLLGPLFIAFVFVNIIPYGYLSIEAYFDSKMDFSLIKLIMNYILFIICLTHGVALDWLTLVMCYWTTLYLKYHFQQIKEQIQECVITGNSQLNRCHT
jgi:prepilin signal peptidase PulO-like enzyme (type II secretory pathway)